jgi:hypothetical protein
MRRARPALACLWIALVLGCSGAEKWPTVHVIDKVTGRSHEARAVLREDGERDDGVTILAGAEVDAGEAADFEFRFTAGSKGLSAGSTLLMVLPSSTWTEPQTKDARAPGYVAIEFPEDSVRCAIDVLPKGSTQTPSRTRMEVHFHIVRGGLAPGRQAVIRYRADRVQAVAQRAPVGFYVDADGEARFAPLARRSFVHIRAGKAVHVRVTCPAEIVVGRPAACRAVALDRFGNIARGDVAPVALAAVGVPLHAPDSIAPQGGRAMPVYVVGEEPGMARLTGTPDPAAGVTFSATPVRVVDREPERRRLWGDLQVHTAFSDSFVRISPREALIYARYGAALDFAAITDHAEGIWGDPMTDHDWARLRDQVEGGFVVDEFAPLLGFEWTGAFEWDPKYPKGPGHWQVLYPGYRGKRFRADDPATDTLAELRAALRGTGAITVPHHTLLRWATTRWTDFDPAFDAVAEVYSTHGGSECASCGPPLDDGAGDDAGAIQEALARGARVGLVASSDNHGGHPGLNDFPGYARLPLDAGGLTCVAADRIAPWPIVDALRARRVYATTGARIYLAFTADGRPMGEEYARTETGGPVLHVEAAGEGEIDRVEIVKFAEGLPRPFPVIFTARPKDWRYAGDFTDPAFDRPSLYYVRVVQKDLEMAWSSPIWVNPPAKP